MTWTPSNPPEPAWGRVERISTSFDRMPPRPPSWGKELFGGDFERTDFGAADFNVGYSIQWSNQTPPAPSWATE